MTPQIRVALKSNSSPILGDMTYSAKEEARMEVRTYLHAAGVRVLPRACVLQCTVLTGDLRGAARLHWGRFERGMGLVVCEERG